MMQSTLMKAAVFGAALLMPTINAANIGAPTLDKQTRDRLGEAHGIDTSRAKITLTADQLNIPELGIRPKDTPTERTDSTGLSGGLGVPTVVEREDDTQIRPRAQSSVPEVDEEFRSKLAKKNGQGLTNPAPESRARSVSDPFIEEEKVERPAQSSVAEPSGLTLKYGKDFLRQVGDIQIRNQSPESTGTPPSNGEANQTVETEVVSEVQGEEAGNKTEEALTVEDLLKRIKVLEAPKNSSTNTKVITGVVGAGLLIGGAAAAVGEGVKVVEKLGLEKFQEQTLGDTNMISFTIGVIAAALGLFILTGLGSHALFGFNPYFWVIQFSILGFMVCSIGGAFSTEIHSLSTGFVDAAHTMGHELGIEGAHHADVNMFFVVSLCFAAGIILLPLLVFLVKRAHAKCS